MSPQVRGLLTIAVVIGGLLMTCDSFSQPADCGNVTFPSAVVGNSSGVAIGSGFVVRHQQHARAELAG